MRRRRHGHVHVAKDFGGIGHASAKGTRPIGVGVFDGVHPQFFGLTKQFGKLEEFRLQGHDIPHMALNVLALVVLLLDVFHASPGTLDVLLLGSGT